MGFGQSNRIENNLLLCPSCMKRVPLIRLEQINDNIFLFTLCSCSKDPTKISLREYLNKNFNVIAKRKCFIASCKNTNNTTFCLSCQVWMCTSCKGNHHNTSEMSQPHVFIFQEVLLNCHKHGLKYETYCDECKIFICTLCKNDSHAEHYIPKVEPFEIFKKHLNDSKEFMDLCGQKKKQIEEKVKIKEVKDLINKCFNMNLVRNNLLSQLITKINNTIDFSAMFSILPLIQTVKNVKFNDANIDKYCEEPSDELVILRFIEFMVNHYIIEVQNSEIIDVMLMDNFKNQFPNWIEKMDPDKKKKRMYDDVDFGKTEYVIIRKIKSIKNN